MEARSRTGRHAILAAAMGLVVLTVRAPSAHAASVEYKNGQLRTRTSYTNGNYGDKTFNGIFAGTSGNGLPVGIYELTQGGAKIYEVNGTGTVVKNHSADPTTAYCWNRSYDFEFMAECIYHDTK